MDELIDRLRSRAADPERRLELEESAFGFQVASMDLGQLFEMGRSVQADLATVVEGGAEAIDPAMWERVQSFEQTMHQPADRPLPPRATEQQVAAAEAAIGVRLPELLRRIYLEVANGGFGPGYGLLGVEGGWDERGSTLADVWHMHAVDGPFEDWTWPEGMIPLAHLGDGVFAFVDASRPDGTVYEWDEDLDWDDEDGPGGPELTEISPSLEAWFEAWLVSPSAAEAQAAIMRRAFDDLEP